MGNAIANCGIDDSISAIGVRDRPAVSFEEHLIDAVVFLEEPQCGLKTLCESIHGPLLEAFIVHSLYFENHPDFAGLGKEDVLPHEAKRLTMAPSEPVCS